MFLDICWRKREKNNTNQAPNGVRSNDLQSLKEQHTTTRKPSTDHIFTCKREPAYSVSGSFRLSLLGKQQGTLRPLSFNSKADLSSQSLLNSSRCGRILTRFCLYDYSLFSMSPFLCCVLCFLFENLWMC